VQAALAAIAYDQEDFERAAELLSSARATIALLGFMPALQATLALLERACGAALSRSLHDGPRPAAVARALFEDLDFVRAMLVLFAADADMFDGNVADAEARACDAEAIAVRGGYRGLQQWAMSTRGECLCMRGRAEDAVALADRALADPLTAVHRRQRVMFLTIAALGLAQLGRVDEARQRVGSLDELTHAPVRAARLSVLPWITPAPATSELARAELALAQLERALSGGRLDDARRFCEAAAPVRTSRWQYLRARLGVLEAELAVRTAEGARAESALREAEALCADRGYLREHATAALVSVAFAQLAGDRERAVERARAAMERAAARFPEIEAAAAQLLGEDVRPAAGHAWIDRLELTVPRSFRLRTGGATHDLTRRQAEAFRFPDGTFTIDARHRTIRVGGVEQSLAKRPGLWSVLWVLAMEPGRVYSPDDLAQHAWGVSYHAVRHRSRLVVTIKRLRDALGGDAIAAVAGGYRLSVAAWGVLEPIADAAVDL
ncbi:MAG TPA: winged helix-turn-helix domain-containing protein, partial [Kofleriaceae bacterium]|nr:winged helix-turn-helix domain-containing protein [Kofleriaceae bacterium]